jgi:hypothetical protein
LRAQPFMVTSQKLLAARPAANFGGGAGSME